MFQGEHRSDILWVSSGIVATPIFKIDVPSSGQCVGFRPEFPRMEMNNKVEARKVFQPSCLMTREDIGCGEVLEVLVVGNNIDWGTGTLNIVLPSLEGFIYRE